MTQTIEQLRARIAELEAENERLKVDRTKKQKESVTIFDVNCELRQQLAAAQEQIANETSWHPIETAPKGERFLTTTKLSNGSFGQVGISHSFFCYEVNTRDWKIAGDDPCATHWMPLPTQPKRSMEGV